MKKIPYYILYGFIWLLSVLPFPVIYLISDLIAGFLHTVIGYRRKAVRENLASAFPDMPEKELRAVERRFYRFLCDYGLETVKLLTMKPETMMKRLRVENPEAVTDATDRGRSVTLLLGHYCNWEWVSSLPLHFKPDVVSAQVYHYLHNHAMNRLFYKLRTRFGANNIPMDEIMRSLITWKREGRTTVTGFIADQRPGWECHLFLDFLHHDTPVFTGPERIARFLDSEVLYCRLQRPRRGYYSLRFLPVTSTPKKEETFSITRRYFDLLEEDITRAPQYWLWSHKRWKRTRQAFYDYWGKEHADTLLTHL